MKTSTWDRRSRASLVSTNVHQLHSVIHTAAASRGVINKAQIFGLSSFSMGTFTC
ncbi:MAG TPA: hypothetical protein VJR69_08435 [Nitrospira sp.]|nr:hypothetical protein [Nitrospira sp.]